MPDVEKTCTDCRNPFTVTEGEQQFLAEKFGSEFKMPKRCVDCRRKRKAAEGSRREDSR